MNNFFIKFNNFDDIEENYIPIKNYSKIFRHKKCINIEKNEQEIIYSNKGFKIYILIETIIEGEIKKEFILLEDFSDYTLLYNETNNELWFSNDLEIWGVYYIYNIDTFYVQRMVVAPRKSEQNPRWYKNYILTEEGTTSAICDHLIDAVIDDEGYYMYKVVDGKVVPVDPDEKVKPEPEPEEEEAER